MSARINGEVVLEIEPGLTAIGIACLAAVKALDAAMSSGETTIGEIARVASAIAASETAACQLRIALALERIADRLETEPVNDLNTHVPYVREPVEAPSLTQE